MPSGAVHPNTGNFSRAAKLNVVDRVRKLVSQGAYEKRPEWMEFVERAPPMELHNLKLRDIKIKSPYPAMIQYVLKRFPDMRFQDCFVDGNDWSKGNDRYRDDHPVMQFVARQLQLMNEGVSKQEAFESTRIEFVERRKAIEERQKLEMALAHNQRIVPAFGSLDYADPLYITGAAIAHQREAQLELAHLNHIRRKLRMLRKEIEPHDKRRMNAKEMALDVEFERNSLLPKMPLSKYKEEAAVVESVKSKTREESPVEPDDHPSVEFFSEKIEDEDEEVFFSNPPREFNTIETSILDDSRGRKPRPQDLSDTTYEDVMSSPKKSSAPLIDFSFSHKPVVTSRTSTEVPRPIMPIRHTPSARPDKQTFQSILTKRKESELAKKIGKEPGANDNDGLDFEDFMNLVRQKK